MADAWGGSWGNPSSWGVSWGSGAGPVTIPASGGSGNQSGRRGGRGSGRRDINDDPDAFSELLKEWRAKRERPHEDVLVQKTPLPDHRKDVGEDHPQEVEAQADELLQQVRRIEAAYDRAMVAYEAALARVEQAKVVESQKAAKAKETAIRQAALEREQQAIEQEELAREQAIQLAIEWELARLAYEDFLEEEDEIMLLS